MEETEPQADERELCGHPLVYVGRRSKSPLLGGSPSTFPAVAEMLPLKFLSNQKSRGKVKFVLKLLGSLSMQRKLN